MQTQPYCIDEPGCGQLAYAGKRRESASNMIISVMADPQSTTN